MPVALGFGLANHATTFLLGTRSRDIGAYLQRETPGRSTPEPRGASSGAGEGLDRALAESMRIMMQTTPGSANDGSSFSPLPSACERMGSPLEPRFPNGHDRGSALTILMRDAQAFRSGSCDRTPRFGDDKRCAWSWQRRTNRRPRLAARPFAIETGRRRRA